MSNKCADMWRQWRERIGIGSSANQQTLAGALWVFSSSCNWPTLTDVDYNPGNVQHCTTVHKGMKDCDQLQPVALSARGWMGFPPSFPSVVFLGASNRGCTIPFFPHLLTKFSSCCFTQVTAKAFQSNWSKFVWGPSLGWGLPTFDSVLSTFGSSGDSLLLHLNICQQAALKCSHWATRMACHTVQKLLQRRYHHKITVDVSSNVRQKKHKTIHNVRSLKKKKEWVAGITMKTKSTKSTNKNHKINLGIRAEDFSPTDLGPCVRRCVCPRQQKWYRWTRHFSEACTVGTGISQVSQMIFINPVTQSTDGEICYDLLSARNRGGFVNGFAWITGSVYTYIYIYIIYTHITYIYIFNYILLYTVL